MSDQFMTIIDNLASGLPTLLGHFFVTLALLAAAIAIYMAVTPFRERALVEEGNAAAGTVLAGAIVAMAIPLAMLLATSGQVIDIVVWGVITLLLQLMTVGLISLLLHGLRRRIDAGNVAAAMVLAAAQIAVGLLNAAVMVPN
jgi:putative membrane protein